MTSAHRREPRYPATLPLRWREGEGAWRSGLSRDLSPRGLFILTGGVPRPNTLVEVELNAPDGVLSLRTTVRWTRSEEGPGAPRGMGVELVDASEELLRAYAVLVDRCADQVAVGLKAEPPPKLERGRPGGVRLANRAPPVVEKRSKVPVWIASAFVAGIAVGWLLRGL